MTANPKRKPLRDRPYLDWLRSQPCIVTGRWSMEPICHPAHVRWGTDGGTGMKPSDYYALPVWHEIDRQHPVGTGADWLTLVNEYPGQGQFLHNLILGYCRMRYAEWKR